MRRLVLTAVGAVVALVLVVGLLERTRRQVDLTAERSLSLSAVSKDVVAHVRKPVSVTAFLDRTSAGRAEAAGLLERYRRLNRRITFRLRDPDDAPGLAQRLGIDPVFGGVALQMGTAVERGPTVTEQDVTAGMARLLRGTAATVCFATGHGEVDLGSAASAGGSAAAALLRSNGYTVQPVDLLAGSSVPAACRALVLARPTGALGLAGGVVAAWLAGGGRALVTVDPESTVDVRAVTEPYRIVPERGVVLEGDDGRHLPGDPLTPVITRWEAGNPLVRRLPPVVLPGAQGLSVQAGARDGMSVSVLGRTTEASYLERDPTVFDFTPGADVRGPVALVAAADASSITGEVVTRTRLVVVAEGDWMTNGFLDQAGNGRLLVQSLDWLTLDEDLVTVSANIPSVRPLTVTDARRRYALFLSAVAMPLFVVLCGLVVWAWRRGR
jgi:hypothetical protein